MSTKQKNPKRVAAAKRAWVTMRSRKWKREHAKNAKASNKAVAQMPKTIAISEKKLAAKGHGAKKLAA